MITNKNMPTSRQQWLLDNYYREEDVLEDMIGREYVTYVDEDGVSRKIYLPDFEETLD